MYYNRCAQGKLRLIKGFIGGAEFDLESTFNHWVVIDILLPGEPTEGQLDNRNDQSVANLGCW